MKRLFILIMAITLTVGLFAFLPGCGSGGDTAKAKEYMQSGDDILEEVRTDSEDFGEQFEELGEEMQSADMSSSDLDKSVSALEETAEDIINKADEAKSEYEKILDLSGVDDYQKYAKLAIDLIENNTTIMEESIGMMKDVVDFFAAFEAGTATEADAESFQTALVETQENIEELVDKSEELYEEMQTLQNDKNL